MREVFDFFPIRHYMFWLKISEDCSLKRKKEKVDSDQMGDHVAKSDHKKAKKLNNCFVFLENHFWMNNS